jgi:ATP-binding cassette subfamily B (MDR/TAP) protein 7
MKNINATLLDSARTSIFIAHRLRTVVEAGEIPRGLLRSLEASSPLTDMIIVLREGTVVEQGTHEELLRAGGLYYSMWQEQAADAFSE